MQIPIRRQLQRLAFLRRLTKGGAVSPRLQVEGHLLRGDGRLIGGGVPQAVGGDDLRRIAFLRAQRRAAADDLRRPGLHGYAASVAAAHSLPVTLDGHTVLPTQGGILCRGNTCNVRAAVRCLALRVRAVQLHPVQRRLGVGQQRNGEVLIGREAPAVRHRAAHLGGGGRNGPRPVWAGRHGLSQVGDGVLLHRSSLLTGDLAAVEGGLGLGVALHPRGNGAGLGAAVIVGHRGPARTQGGLHAARHRRCKGYRLCTNEAAALVGLAGERSGAAELACDLRRQALRYGPGIAAPCLGGNGPRRAAEAVAQRMGKGRGCPGQADGRLAADGHRPDRGRGGPGYGGQGETLGCGGVVAVAEQPSGKGCHGKALGSVCVVAQLQRSRGEGAVLVVRYVGVGAAVVHLYPGDAYRRHLDGIVIILLPRGQAAGPRDGGLVVRDALAAGDFPFYPKA